ncbi:ABC transporter permease [Planctomycetota bacterium]
MIRKQLNIIRLSIDNLQRRWKIYFLLAGAAGIGTAIILFLLLSAEGLRHVAQKNLMLLPLNKLWIRPGSSPGGSGEKKAEARITEDLIREFENDPEVTRVWPQVDYRLSAFVELIISVVVYKEKFDSIVEVYGVHKDLVKDDLFKGCSFDFDEEKPGGKVPVMLPSSVVNMLNKKIARMASLPEGKQFPVDIIKNFNANIYLEMDRRTGEKGYMRIPCKPVGVSPNIPQIGVAVPIAQAKKWNAGYGGQKGETAYSRVLVETVNPQKAADLSLVFEKKGFVIESSRSTFEQIQNLFAGIQGTVVVFGFLIVISVGVGLFNGMNLVVFSERDIIGVMRAVGAKRRDIIESLLLQAVATGIIGGVIGSAVAFGAGFGIEQSLISLIRSYGISADSLFDFKPLWAAGGILIPPLVFVIFSLLPALNSVAIEPSEALK